MKFSFRKTKLCLLLVILFFLSINSSNAQDTTSFEKIKSFFNSNFSGKDLDLINSLSPVSQEKLKRAIEIVRNSRQNQQKLSEECATEICKKQKLLEKCSKEKSTSSSTATSTVSSECKNVDINLLAQQLNQALQPKSSEQLQTVPNIPQDLMQEKAILRDINHDMQIDRALAGMQTNPPPLVPRDVLSQDPGNIVTGQGEYLGEFACKQDGGGSFYTSDRPRNQGGLVQDELFYGIANAAQASGVKAKGISCFSNRNIAGTNIPSQHSIGAACDIVLSGQSSQKTAFIVFFLANTGNYNTVGSYASRGFDHSHLGGDCGRTWCPYQKGQGLEPWKELAFRTVFQACGQTWNAGARPPKKWVQDCAKKAVEKFCQNK